MCDYLNADICRACLAAEADMTSVFQTRLDRKMSLKDLIMAITNVQICEEDGLTLMVCGKCMADAEGAYDFKIRCETSDALLRTKAEGIAEKAEDESKVFEDFKVKEELEDVKYNPYGDDDDNDGFDPMDTLCLKESLGLQDDDLLYLRRKSKLERKSERRLKRERSRGARVKNKKVRLKFGAESDDKPKNAEKLTYSCDFCKAIFRSAHVHRKHLKRVHGMAFVLPTATAAEDELIDVSDKAAEDEDDVVKADREYRCDRCEFKTAMFSVLKRHTLEHTGRKPIFCDECNYRCVDVGSLVKHKRKHSGEKPYACDKCVYRANTPYSLKTHMATHSSLKPYACKLCSFTCKLSSSLIQHVARKHERRKDHACPTCGKRFFSVSHMRIHQRVHSGEKPHVCDKCGTAFSQKSNLEKHAALMHAAEGDTSAKRRFACEHCSYRANTLYTLRNHTLKHSGEKPSVCDLCDYKCISISALKIHKQRHVGDARHACDTCPYRCYTLGRLKAHKRRHTGERPYPCTKCDYRAKTNCSLRNHMASHKNEQPYACKNCPYRANYKSNLVKHEQKLCGKMGKQSAAAAAKAAGDSTRDKTAAYNSTPGVDFKATVDSVKEDRGIDGKEQQ